MNMVERTECNRPHSRYPPSLHALNGINAVSRGFSGDKEVIKSANTKTSRSSLDIIKWQIMVGSDHSYVIGCSYDHRCLDSKQITT